MALSVNGALPTAPDVACQTVPDPSTCTATWVIETWSLPLGTITLQVGVLTLDSEAFSDPVHVLLADHPPIARITSPADATTFVPSPSVPANYRSGMLHVAVDGGQIGVAAGTVAAWQLLVDGATTTATATCASTWTATGYCTADLYWAAGLAGPHILVARLTVGTTVADSPAVTVTVVRPTVAITSPADGSVFYRSPTIIATGAIATAGDAPVSMGLVVNGVQQGSLTPCPPNPTSPGTCTVTLPLFLGLGRNTLSTTVSAFFLTTRSSAMSAPITVTRYVHRTLWWSDPDGTGPAGTPHTLVGHLRNDFGPGDAGVAVTVVVTPAVGKPSTRQVVTDAAGAFTLTVRPAVKHDRDGHRPGHGRDQRSHCPHQGRRPVDAALRDSHAADEEGGQHGALYRPWPGGWRQGQPAVPCATSVGTCCTPRSPGTASLPFRCAGTGRGRSRSGWPSQAAAPT